MIHAPASDGTNLHIEAAALTNRGQQRPLNEDTVFEFTTQPKDGTQAGLYLVCDGLGGHEADEVASQLATQAIVAQLGPILIDSQTSDCDPEALHEKIAHAIDRANHKVWAYNNQKDLVVSRRAGTTVTLALLLENTAVVANVGDSRAYLWRDGQLEQITKDHSLVAQLVDSGVIDPQEQDQHPWRNIITRALGRDREIEVDLFDYELQPGDKLLLCSDGLWQAFAGRGELESWLDKPGTAHEICRQLIREANQRDGSDNISVVLICADGLLLES